MGLWGLSRCGWAAREWLHPDSMCRDPVGKMGMSESEARGGVPGGCPEVQGVRPVLGAVSGSVAL